MKAVGYVRVSSNDQHNSVEAQEAKIRAQAEIKEYTLLDTIIDEDEFSGDMKRPGIQRVLEMIRKKTVAAVIFAKWDRMSRSVRDSMEILELGRKHGVALISIAENFDTESAMGRCMFQIMASFAEMERTMIGSRTRDGLKNIKASGFAIGTAPYGYSIVPRTADEKERREHTKLVVNKSEQMVISLINVMRKDRLKWDDIASRLNKLGYRRRTGSEWDFRGAHQIWRLAQKQNQEAA